METLNIKEYLHGNGDVPVHIIGLTGGTVSGYAQATAGTDPPYKDTILTWKSNIDIAVTLTQTTKESAVEQKFRKLADQWRKETGHLSSITKKVMHPAYQQIIGMGRDALPLILRELKRTRGHWLWALFSITGEDPAQERSTFAEAVDAWLSWGISHGYAAPD